MKTKYQLAFTFTANEDTKTDKGYDGERISHLFTELKSNILMKKLDCLVEYPKKTDPMRIATMYHLDKDLAIIDQMIDSFDLRVLPKKTKYRGTRI